MILKHVLSADAGELSPWLDARTDIAKYASGFRMLKNFIVTPQGGVTKRPGMEYRGALVASATTGRLIEFQIASDDAAILALGGGELRFWINGTMLLTDDTPPVPYALAIPWADADILLVRWKQINDVMYFTHPDFAPWKLTHLANDSWTLAEVDFGVNVPLLPENTVPELTITATYSGTWTTPAAWHTGHTYYTGDRATYDGKTWVCNLAHQSITGAGNTPDLYYYTYRGINYQYWTETFIDTSSTVGQEVALTASGDIWSDAHVGSVWELARLRPATGYEATLPATAAGTNAFSSTIIVQGAWKFESFGTWYGTFTVYRSLDRGNTWEQLRSYTSTAAAPRNVSAESEEKKRVLMRFKWVSAAADAGGAPYGMLTALEAKTRGLVKITAVTNAKTATAVTISTIESGATPYWSQGAWSDYQGWPRCLEIHQGRLLMAATTLRPHSIWGSAVDDYPNFRIGTDADEAFFHTIMVGERDPILWLVSEKYLLIGSGSGEFVMHGETEEAAITPEFANTRRQTSFGSHDGGVSAVFSDSIALFLQRGGTRVREFFYKLESDRYESANLNLLADHIFDNEAVGDTAVMRMPFQVIWFVAGGKFYGLTYERAQNVVAWHRHETDGEVLSVATVRTAGVEDEVWFLVDRGGDLQVERFRPGAITDPQDDGWWSDAAVSLPSPYDLATVPHLAGMDAYAFWDGSFYGPNPLTGAWPFITGMLLSGFPTASANTRFQSRGERAGKQWYSITEGDEGYSIQWNTGPGSINGSQWIVYLENNLAYTSNQDVATPDLVTVWTPQPGYEWNQVEGEDVPGVIVEDSGNPAVEPTTIVISGCSMLNFNGEHTKTADGVWKMTDQMGIETIVSLVDGLWQMSSFNRTYTAGAAETYPWEVEEWYLGETLQEGLTVTIVESAVILGLRYDAVYYPMKPEIPMANGSSRSREMRIHRIVPSLYLSRSGKFGTDPDADLLPLACASGFTGEVEKAFPGGFAEDGNFCIVSDEPVPFAIRSVAIKFNVYGDSN